MEKDMQFRAVLLKYAYKTIQLADGLESCKPLADAMSDSMTEVGVSDEDQTAFLMDMLAEGLKECM